MGCATDVGWAEPAIEKIAISATDAPPYPFFLEHRLAGTSRVELSLIVYRLVWSSRPTVIIV
jgi:hypothetical protein